MATAAAAAAVAVMILMLVKRLQRVTQGDKG